MKVLAGTEAFSTDIFYFWFQFNDLKGDKHEVTIICRCPDKRHLAVGYDDGTVRVFDLTSGDLLITFSGHKSAVTALRYDRQGLRLVSGARVSVIHACLSCVLHVSDSTWAREDAGVE